MSEQKIKNLGGFIEIIDITGTYLINKNHITIVYRKSSPRLGDPFYLKIINYEKKLPIHMNSEDFIEILKSKP